MINAGAKLVGGCCGSNPDYIRYIITEHRKKHDNDKIKTHKHEKLRR